MCLYRSCRLTLVRTSVLIRAKKTQRCHISKSTFRGAYNWHVTFVPDVGTSGGRTRRCSLAAAAV
jgi:hypothetical protein